MRPALVVLLLCMVANGCSSLNTIQESDYMKMQAEGVLVEEKNPSLAACLGFLPGCGSFYCLVTTFLKGGRSISLTLACLEFWWDPPLPVTTPSGAVAE